jgi:hypothetical protein
MKKDASRQRGYSLATLAILVAAFSAATVGLMTYTQYEPIINKKTEDLNEVSDILQHLKNYGAAKNILPCPADPTLPPSDANYLTSAGAYPNCSSSLPRKSTNYYKGLLPTRTLGINDNFAFDHNNGLLSYMVGVGTNYFKVNIAPDCLNKEGVLQGTCSYTNNSQFMQFNTSTAPNVVVISHGADQVGAFKKDHTSATTFSKSTHQITPEVLPNGKYFDSVSQAINHDYYLTDDIDEIIFKPITQLGNPANTSQTPGNIKYDDTVIFARINVGDGQSGVVKCWGNSGEGGTVNPAGLRAKALYAINQNVCAIKEDNTVKCWGNPDPKYTAPSFSALELPLKTVSVSSNAFCVIKQNDELKCWGDSDSGGDRSGLLVSKLPKSEHKRQGAMCATIKDTNVVTCWGNTSKGGSTPPGSITATSLVTSSSAICAIKTNEEVQCWGTGASATSTPASLVASSITAGTDAVCAIQKSDSQVRCWGTSGAGNSTSGTIYAKELFGGLRRLCAIKTNDDVECWGDTNYAASAPANTKVKTMVMAESATCAIRQDNVVQCWGPGNGGSGGGFAAKSLAASLEAICAIRDDNERINCWGNSGYGASVPADITTAKALAIVGTNTAMCAIIKD